MLRRQEEKRMAEYVIDLEEKEEVECEEEVDVEEQW